jgi:hypothetical protein
VITCFVAGIVKGIVEHDDATRHFGSLMAFQGHLSDAVAAGVVTFTKKVTDLGHRYYTAANLKELPGTRAYMWPSRDWTKEIGMLRREDSDNG